MYRHAKDFNCDTCQYRHCDESKPAPVPVWSLKNSGLEIESRVCFKPMITEESVMYIRLYSHYKNHFLPLSGGILDQPNAYLQAMEVIDGAANG